MNIPTPYTDRSNIIRAELKKLSTAHLQFTPEWNALWEELKSIRLAVDVESAAVMVAAIKDHNKECDELGLTDLKID